MFDLGKAEVSDQTLINIHPHLLAPQLETNEIRAHAEESPLSESIQIYTSLKFESNLKIVANVDIDEDGQGL